MTIIETSVENVLKGDRISFHRDSEPRKVLSVTRPAHTLGEDQVWVIYDEAGLPAIHKTEGADVFVHFSDRPVDRKVTDVNGKVAVEVTVHPTVPESALVRLMGVGVAHTRFTPDGLRDLAYVATAAAQELETYGADR